jgi:hypothetical protein
MKGTCSALVILLAFWLPQLGVESRAVTVSQQPTAADPLERPVSELDMTPRTVRDTFFLALCSAHVPGGCAIVFGCDELQPITVAATSGTPLRQVLDALVRADPRYRWEVDNGVLDLLPAAGEPSLPKTQIPRFQAESVKSVDSAIGQIEQMPEVTQRMADLGLGYGIRSWVGPTNPKAPPPFDVNCVGLTLRGVLNEIVGRSGSAQHWQYIEAHCGSTNDIVITSF